MFPGLTNLTTYSGPQGGGAGGFGFSLGYSPYQGAQPSTIESLLQTPPITAPGAAATFAAPESLTGAIAMGGPERLSIGRQEFGGQPSVGGMGQGGMGAGGMSESSLAGPTGAGQVASQESGGMGALQGALGFGVSPSMTGAQASPVGQLAEALGINPTAANIGATALGMAVPGLGPLATINTAIGLGRATPANLAASQTSFQRSPAFQAQRMGEIESAGMAPIGSGFPTAGPALAAEVEAGLAPPSDIANPNVMGAPGTQMGLVEAVTGIATTPSGQLGPSPSSTGESPAAPGVGTGTASGLGGATTGPGPTATGESSAAPGVGTGTATGEGGATTGPGPTATGEGPSTAGGGDGGGGSKVICTELHRLGLLPEYVWRADLAYAKQVDPQTYRGYLRWAPTMVRWSRRSRLFRALMAPVALCWAREMAFRMGARPDGSRVGAGLMRLGEPLCHWLGRPRSGVWAALP